MFYLSNCIHFLKNVIFSWIKIILSKISDFLSIFHISYKLFLFFTFSLKRNILIDLHFFLWLSTFYHFFISQQNFRLFMKIKFIFYKCVTFFWKRFFFHKTTFFLYFPRFYNFFSFYQNFQRLIKSSVSLCCYMVLCKYVLISFNFVSFYNLFSFFVVSRYLRVP